MVSNSRPHSGSRALQLLLEGVHARDYLSPLLTNHDDDFMTARWDDEKAKKILFIRWNPASQYYCQTSKPNGSHGKPVIDLSVDDALNWLGQELIG